jgi:hypothetical protein
MKQDFTRPSARAQDPRASKLGLGDLKAALAAKAPPAAAKPAEAKPVKEAKPPATPQRTRKERAAARVRYDRRRLAYLFPQVFAKPGQPGPRKPLKIDIHLDIAARGATLDDACRLPYHPRRLRRALQDYVSGPKYLRALVECPYRHDLDGNPGEPVSPEHKAEAAAKLAALEAQPKKEG